MFLGTKILKSQIQSFSFRERKKGCCVLNYLQKKKYIIPKIPNRFTLILADPKAKLQNPEIFLELLLNAKIFCHQKYIPYEVLLSVNPRLPIVRLACPSGSEDKRVRPAQRWYFSGYPPQYADIKFRVWEKFQKNFWVLEICVHDRNHSRKNYERSCINTQYNPPYFYDKLNSFLRMYCIY